MKLKNIFGLLIVAGTIVACSSSNNDVEPTAPPTDGVPTVQPSDSIPNVPTVPPTDGEPTVPPTDGEPTVPPTDGVPTVVVVDTMEVNVRELNVTAEGGEIEFITTTNLTYRVEANVDWITINSTGRTLTADYTVKATVAVNSGEAREGKITIFFDDELSTMKSVKVQQEAKPEEPSQELAMSVGKMTTTTWEPQIIK
jgi:hypothetical protein